MQGKRIHPTFPRGGYGSSTLASHRAATLIRYFVATRANQLPKASSSNGLGAKGHGSRALLGDSRNMFEMPHFDAFVTAPNRQFCRIV
jgi:hypothetical protein